MPLLVWSDEEVALDPALVGSKFASLAALDRWPVRERPQLVPGAALSTEAWHLVVDHAGLGGAVRAALAGDAAAADELSRSLQSVALPEPVDAALRAALARLGDSALAVRSSAVAEDLVGRSFAGQYRTCLDVVGVEAAADAYRTCLASAWQPAMMAYRRTTSSGFDDPAMAVVLQPMVHDGDGWAGAALSDGAGAVVVEVVRGWGDALMSGRADPLRWEVAPGEQPDAAVAASVVEWVRRAERRTGAPIEVEFALRRAESVPVVLQLRTHAPGSAAVDAAPTTWSRGLVNGLAVGRGMVRGPVCRLDGVHEMDRLVPGGVLVTSMTDPAWVPLMGHAAAVVTDHGGSTSHAAIVCRELGLLAVVGCGDATSLLDQGRQVEVRCEGSVGSVVPLS
jgi:pyruvate,water dikinase